jgi:hypothetical protein
MEIVLLILICMCVAIGYIIWFMQTKDIERLDWQIRMEKKFREFANNNKQ